MNKSIILGYLAGVSAVLFWSFNVIFSKYLTYKLFPWQISFYRWLIAGIIIFPFVINGIIAKHEIIKKNFKNLFLISLTGITLMNTFSYFAGYTISAVEMSIIGILGPIFIIILASVFLKTDISKIKIVGILVSFLGVLTVVLHAKMITLSTISFKMGDFYMLLLAVFFAIYTILTNKRPRELTNMEFLGVIIFLGIITIFPFFVYETIKNPICWTPEIGGILIYMGLFNSLISYLFWNITLEKLGNVSASILYYLMPIFSSVEAYFILGENIYPAQLYGGGLVVLGILITTLHKRQVKKDISRL